MKKNLSLFISSIVILLLFVLLQLVFILRQGEVAVVTRLGKPVREVVEPGIYKRLPWPIQKIYRYDNRVRTLDTSFEESLTHDGKNILVGLYAGWRISEPIKFLERVGRIDQAESNLDGLLRANKNAEIGQLQFANFVNVNPAELRFDSVQEQILSKVQPEALERYGIEVTVVGLHRMGVPEAITESIFERMRAERAEKAERYRSEGEGESIKIRAQADSERATLLAQARADAKHIRAEAEAAASEYYQEFQKDPELAMFLRKLEAMEEILREKSTVILSAESQPFDLLKNQPSGGE